MQRISYTVLLILITLASCSGGGQYSEMRQRLEALNALNRADSVLTATERNEAQTLANYFDRHGTSNDQLLAHYLLGRCYADMHEAPMALHCYQEAISRADTLSPDCDFAQLSRVYGQSASIFYQQGLYRDQLECTDISVKYAWKGKDTLSALVTYAKKAIAYDQLLQKDSAIQIYTDAIRQLKANKYNKVAAGFSGTLAKKLIDKGEISRALPYLHDYEQHSGYFDSLGNIVRGREIYYNCKGLYSLKANQLDSAESYFRKELRDGKDYGNQNSGSRRLAQLFLLRNQPDSAAKYALYAYDMNDSVYAQRATHEVEQAKAMYDYSRQQEIAYQERENAERKQRIIWLILTGMAVVFTITVYVFHRLRRKQREKVAAYEKLVKDHVAMQAEVMQLRERKTNYDLLLSEKEKQAETLGTALSEIEELKAEKSQFDQLLKEKENLIEKQKVNIRKYMQLARTEKEETKKRLEDSAMYKTISDKIKAQQLLTEKDWKLLERFVVERMPDFYQFVSSRQYALTTKMYHVCILLRLQVDIKSIAFMMGVDHSTVSKTCGVIFKKLYGVEGGGKDLGRKLIQFN